MRVEINPLKYADITSKSFYIYFHLLIRMSNNIAVLKVPKLNLLFMDVYIIIYRCEERDFYRSRVDL